MKSTIRRWALVNLLVILGLVASAFPAQAQANNPGETPATPLQNCSAVDEEALQGELNVVTQQVFATALTGLDLDAIVGRQWVTLELDQAVDDAVDRAVERVRGETDLWNKFLSGWSPDKARELTLAIANYTFDDPAFRTQMDELSNAISADVADELALASAESVSAALYCLQTFIGGNYAQVLVRAFESRVQAATSSANLVEPGELSPSLLAIVGEHGLALGGVGVIIASQIVRKVVVSIAQRISQRVAGRIVGRVLGRVGSTLIPLAGWIVGAGLIAYDVYTSLDGALPQIQETMKSAPVKAGIRDEIARAVKPELETELPGLARTIANDLFVEWRNVKRDIRTVLDLAASDPDFAALLQDLQTEEQFSRLVELVGLVQANGGRAELDRVVADGTLRKIVDLPASAVTVARDSGSLEQALRWHEAVGSRLDQVAELELHKQLDPAALDMDQLDRLLALDDATAAARVTLLPREQQTALLALPTANLRTLASLLSPDDLGWVAATLPQLEPAQQDQLVARLLSQPDVVAPLRRSGAMDQVGRSGDLDAAITFLTTARDLPTYWLDAAAAVTGGVSLPLFAAKHGVWPTLGGALLVLLAALLILRIVYGLGRWLLEPLLAVTRRR